MFVVLLFALGHLKYRLSFEGTLSFEILGLYLSGLMLWCSETFSSSSWKRSVMLWWGFRLGDEGQSRRDSLVIGVPFYIFVLLSFERERDRSQTANLTFSQHIFLTFTSLKLFATHFVLRNPSPPETYVFRIHVWITRRNKQILGMSLQRVLHSWIVIVILHITVIVIFLRCHFLDWEMIVWLCIDWKTTERHYELIRKLKEFLFELHVQRKSVGVCL
jgi:hypothetical protein